MSWLLDTNIVSELKRPRPERRVTDFLLSCRSNELYVSDVTLAEIRYGVVVEVDPIRRENLEQWLELVVRPVFAGRVLSISEDVMLRWRILVEQGRRTGRTFSQPDLILAATALEHGMTLVTRNVKDFAGIDLRILNPWDADI